MIIYDYREPVEFQSGNCVGVTGENLAYTQEFLIKGVNSPELNYRIFLRFSDGSVNSIIPDSTSVDENGTKITWIVKKTDIFMHGYFELQIEGRNSDELIFQTEIVTLCADESLVIEDGEFANPNAETLHLRDETQQLLSEISQQQLQIDANAELIAQSDLSKKADKANTIGGYGIIDCYTKSQTNERLKTKQNKLAWDIVPQSGSDAAMTSASIYNALKNKEDISNKVCSADQVTDESVNFPTLEYVNSYYCKNNEVYSKAEADRLFDGKLDLTEIETGSGTLSVYESHKAYIKKASFSYRKFGGWVDINISIVMNEYTPGSASSNIMLTTLPFVCKNETPPREICVTTAKKQMLFVIGPKTTNLILLYFNTSSFADGETLSFTTTYKI